MTDKQPDTEKHFIGHLPNGEKLYETRKTPAQNHEKDRQGRKRT